jgi:hypothetical protein
MVCGKDKPVGCFHRNIQSSLYKHRGGYNYCCADCINSRAADIWKKGGARTALAFLCAAFDRAYISSLADKVIGMNQSPVVTFGQYMRRINLYTGVRNKGGTFELSDIFDKEGINGQD